MKRKLNATTVKNAKAGPGPRKLADGGGLFLFVLPNGSKLWRYRYRIGGRENVFAIGRLDDLSLEQARRKHEEARELVRRGIHPARHERVERERKRAAVANTFEAVAREWMAERRESWSPGYAKQVESTLRRYAFPRLGSLPVGEIRPHQVLEIVRSAKKAVGGDKKNAHLVKEGESDAKKGTPVVAALVQQLCSLVFRFAVATQRAEADPVASIRGYIQRQPVRHHRPLARDEIPELLGAIEESSAGLQVRVALKLLLYTFARPNEVCGAEWGEIDFTRAEWRIPPGRMKMRDEHIVPLSSQSAALLESMRPLTAHREHVFPNARDPRRPMRTRALNAALERMGFAGRFSPHGFRATASTMLNELGYRPDVIERQLAHQPRNKVRAAYNWALLLDERRQLMADWANLIDSLARQENVVAGRFGATSQSSHV